YQLRGMSAEEADNVRNKKDNLPKVGWIVEIRGFTYHDEKDRFVLNTLVENLVDLARVDPKTRELKGVKLHPETEKVIREKIKNDTGEVERSRVGYVLLYDYDTDPNPRPGTFVLINRSATAELLALVGGPSSSSGERVGPGVPVKPKGAEPSGEGDKKDPTDDKANTPNRSAWHPPAGTEVGASFRMRGTGGLGGRHQRP